MRDALTVIRCIERNGTRYLTLSDGTNARRTADGRSHCLNRRCIATRTSWDCPHSTAAALWEPDTAGPALTRGSEMFTPAQTED